MAKLKQAQCPHRKTVWIKCMKFDILMRACISPNLLPLSIRLNIHIVSPMHAKNLKAEQWVTNCTWRILVKETKGNLKRNLHINLNDNPINPINWSDNVTIPVVVSYYASNEVKFGRRTTHAQRKIKYTLLTIKGCFQSWQIWNNKNNRSENCKMNIP